jgi:hypothetical protein
MLYALVNGDERLAKGTRIHGSYLFHQLPNQQSRTAGSKYNGVLDLYSAGKMAAPVALALITLVLGF